MPEFLKTARTEPELVRTPSPVLIEFVFGLVVLVLAWADDIDPPCAVWLAFPVVPPSSKRLPAPSRHQIVEANRALFDTMVIDDPERRCWKCDEDTRLFCCHVVAHRHGGSTEPANYFLLCLYCHRKQPDSLPRAAQELWVHDRVTRDEQQLRDLIRTCKTLLERADEAGVRYKELTAYLQSEACLSVAKKMDWLPDFEVVCTSLEYLVAEFLKSRRSA